MMLAMLIWLGWAFLVACACLLGTNRELAREQEANGKLREVNKSEREARELAMRKAVMLLSYVDSEREFAEFDQVLKELPRGHYYGHPMQHRAMVRGDFALAAHNILCTPCDDAMSITALSFDSVRFKLRDREIQGWQREGWVLIPKEALS